MEFGCFMNLWIFVTSMYASNACTNLTGCNSKGEQLPATWCPIPLLWSCQVPFHISPPSTAVTETGHIVVVRSFHCLLGFLVCGTGFFFFGYLAPYSGLCVALTMVWLSAGKSGSLSDLSSHFQTPAWLMKFVVSGSPTWFRYFRIILYPKFALFASLLQSGT